MARPPLPTVLKAIAREEWPNFFESFTREHAGWLVSVDGERVTMPLERVLAREGGRIVIHLGNDLAHHRIITIDAATVRAAEKVLQIESTDGHRTHLALSSPRA